MNEYKQIYQNDESIDLFQLIEDLWFDKWKILFISIFTTAIGVFLYYSSPKNFYIKTDINPSRNTTFIDYTPLNRILNENEFDYNINSSTIFNAIIDEFDDYEELKSVFEKNKKLNSIDLGKLDKDQKDYLFNQFATKFKIHELNKNQTNWIISIIWEDVEEATRIFEETMHLVLENVKNSTVQNVNKYADFLDFKNQNLIENLESEISSSLKLQSLNDKQRIKHLYEQSQLARTLDIKTNKDFLSPNSNSSIDYSIDYLRGYEILEKEMNLLLDRSDNDRLLFSKNYIIQKNEIELLNSNKSSMQLRDISTIIKNDLPDDWIDYNFGYVNVSPVNKSLNFYITIFFFIGFFLSSFYVIIKRAFEKRKLIN